LWEYQHDNRDIDPRNLPAINLSVPSMTFEQERTAFMWSKVKAIKAACEQGEQETPEEILQRLGKLMKHNLIVPAQAEFGKMKDKGKFFDPEAEPTEFLRCEPSLDII
jgi:hypothetical protein